MEVYGAYRANVALVRDAIRENKAQMGSVDSALGTFQTGLLRVEREMLPIYSLTDKLRATQRNIDLCVLELRGVRENFVAAQELSGTLMNGSKFGQDEYVRALQKLLDAIAFLESHRSYEGSSKALEQAKELLAQARRRCMADFVSAVGVLSRASRDASGDASDAAVAARSKRTAESATGGVLTWSSPSKKETNKVSQLLHCLLSSDIDQTELFTEYGKQRFQVVLMAMSDDDASVDAMLPSSVGFHVAANSVAELADTLHDIESSIGAEKRLAQAIFPTEELAHAAFRYAAHPVLDALRGDLETGLQLALASASSASVSLLSPLSPGAMAGGGKQPTAAQALDPFKLLALHELVVARAGDLEALVAPPLLLRDRKGVGRDDPWVLSHLLAATVAQLASATKQKLFGFQFELTDRIGVGDRSLSKDGNVHPVSSYMLSFLRQLCEHTKPLKVLLARQESNLTPKSFVETVVMQLTEALQTKSAQFRGRSDLKQLFLVNNLGYIASSLLHCMAAGGGAGTCATSALSSAHSSEAEDIETHIQTEIRPRLEQLRDEAIEQFVDGSYRSFQSFLVEPTEKLVYARGSDLLTLESGRLLKEKFARFNTQLDDICKTHKSFVVAEPQVRHRIIQAAVDAIIPQYTKFYGKYSLVHFSKKNSSRYLKYTPATAEQALKELFMGEAVASEHK
ncbi:hypothetical protein PybrP1_002190 [[Pythium] brassicae (nom. inval.)]|nr:hypothetical protein PybrP1_002190 [[Pythium] brassicae (nom. inval.)]